MWPFRRKAGRHELGAAVTAVPTAHVAPVAQALATERISAQQADTQETGTPPAPPYEVPVVSEPRVELGFRDGSTAALAPGSAQAKALTEIASALVRRD
ncbi:MAG: hypothetical protein JWM02_368 [Frankiales bacterium]|nr:hypothetical protein [Frankiales bacterium]